MPPKDFFGLRNPRTREDLLMDAELEAVASAVGIDELGTVVMNVEDVGGAGRVGAL